MKRGKMLSTQKIDGIRHFDTDNGTHFSDLELIYKKYEQFDHTLPDGRLARYMPVHIKAALAGDKDALRTLYKYGADFNQRYNGYSICYLITQENVLPEVDANEVMIFLMDHGARFDSLVSALSFLANFGMDVLPSIECAIRVEKDRRNLNDALQMTMNGHILALQDQTKLKAEITNLLLQYGAKFPN
jgi:hypothetical protein